MANQFVQVNPDSSGKKVQTFENTVGANVVESQGVVLVDTTGTPASILATTPVGTENGLAVRQVGAVTVAGTATVTQQAITKGTQGAVGVTTQDLKDAGRQAVTLVWERVAGTAAVESALTNFTSGVRAGAALGAATSYTVTAGKTLRIQSISIALTATSTIVNNARFRIRQAASAIANTSPIIFSYDMPWQLLGTVAANDGVSATVPFPDGLEVAGGQQITFTWITAATTCTVSMTIVGYEY